MGLSISVGVLDGLGIAMFLPLLQMTDPGASVDPEGLGKLSFLLEGIEAAGLSLSLFNVLLAMIIFFTLKGIAQYVNNYYDVILRQLFVRSIRLDLSNSLSRMSFKAFVMSDAGRIQNTMSGEVMRISKAYQGYFGVFQQVVLMLVYMSFAFFLDARFAILIMVGGWLTNFIYKRLYTDTKISSRRLTRGTNLYQGLILQFISNFKYLKATGFLGKYNRKLKNSILDIEENNRKIGKLTAIVTSLREPVLIMVVSAVIMVQVMVMNGTLGTILISLLFFYRALGALILLQSHYNEFLAVSGSLENMTSFEKELVAVQEPQGEIEITNFSNSLELKDVNFQYLDQTVLKNINLRIRKNETVAFVGESGSGKTTLINILSGLLPVEEGEFLIDETRSSKIKIKSYSRRIGYITQEPVIFNDTIFNNVSFFAEPTPQNHSRFEWAIQQASIEEYIKDLPDGKETLLGNDGINLSGGQKQRISIARELFKDVDILILDEATSSLDSETEEAIQKAILKLQGRYTLLIVAHRLSTIKDAQRIFVLSRGEIIDEGNFGELILKSSRFQKMVELQEVS